MYAELLSYVQVRSNYFKNGEYALSPEKWIYEVDFLFVARHS